MSSKQYHNVVVLTFVVMFGEYHVKAVVGRKVAGQVNNITCSGINLCCHVWRVSCKGCGR